MALTTWWVWCLDERGHVAPRGRWSDIWYYHMVPYGTCIFHYRASGTVRGANGRADQQQVIVRSGQGRGAHSHALAQQTSDTYVCGGKQRHTGSITSGYETALGAFIVVQPQAFGALTNLHGDCPHKDATLKNMQPRSHFEIPVPPARRAQRGVVMKSNTNLCESWDMEAPRSVTSLLSV